MHSFGYIYFLDASSNTYSSYLSLFISFCLWATSYIAKVISPLHRLPQYLRPLCAFTRTPPGTVQSFYICKWSNCSLPQPYNYCSSLLNIIWRCIKPQAGGELQARLLRVRGKNVKCLLFMTQSCFYINKYFSPSSSSFVIVMVHPASTLTTEKGGETVRDGFG